MNIIREQIDHGSYGVNSHFAVFGHSRGHWYRRPKYKREAAYVTNMASALADQECEACTSADEPLAEADYAEYLEELDDDVWTVIDEHHLEGAYEFEDFRDALEFTYEVGELAEEEWHHPDIHLQWGAVTIEMWTHKIDGLHKTDFVMAARMDRIHEDYAPE